MKTYNERADSFLRDDALSSGLSHTAGACIVVYEMKQASNFEASVTSTSVKKSQFVFDENQMITEMIV